MEVDDGHDQLDVAKFYEKMMERAKKEGFLDVVDDTEVIQFKEYFVQNSDSRDHGLLTKPYVRFSLFQKKGYQVLPEFYPYYSFCSLRPLVGVFVGCSSKAAKGKEREVKGRDFAFLQQRMWREVFHLFPEECKEAKKKLEQEWKEAKKKKKQKDEE